MAVNTTVLSDTMSGVRNLDTAKEASIDLVALNNTVVNMRSVVKSTKVRVIHKLTREIQKLKTKKGTEQQKEKNLRKSRRLLEEIFAIKELNADHVTKFALANTVKYTDVCQKPSVELQTKSLLRLCDHQLLVEKVEAFRKTHADWEELATFLLRKTGRRFRTKAQKERAAKRGKGSRIVRKLPTDLDLLGQEGGCRQDRPSRVVVAAAAATDNNEGDSTKTGSNSAATDKDSAQISFDSAEVDKDNAEADSDRAETDEDIVETKNDCAEADSDGDETDSDSSQTDEDNAETKNDCAETDSDGDATDNDSSETKNDCADTDSDGDETDEDTAETKNDCADTDSDSDETDEDTAETKNDCAETDSDSDETDNDGDETDKDIADITDGDATDKGNNRDGNKSDSRSRSVNFLTKAPATSALVEDPFFTCDPAADDGLARHWIEQETVDTLHSHSGYKRGYSQHQRQPWQKFQREDDQDDRWLRGDGDRPLRGRGRGRGRGGHERGRGHGGHERGRGRGGHERGRGRFPAKGGSSRDGGRSGGDFSFRQGRGRSSRGSDRGWKSGSRDGGRNGGDSSFHQGRSSHGSDRGGKSRPNKFNSFRGQGQKDRSSQLQAVAVDKKKATARASQPDPTSHPSWDAHRKRKQMEKSATFSGKHFKFDD